MTSPRDEQLPQIEVDGYLRQLERALRRRGLTDPRILDEARDHLVDAMEQGLRRGLTREAAARDAVARFGEPDVVAEHFATGRFRMRNRVVVTLACLAGLLIAYVDSRPAWDDAGVTAFAMLLVAGVCGMVAPRRPWRWALAVGIWIPLYAIVRHPSAGALAMAVVLIFPLTGAYVGMALRRLQQRGRPPGPDGFRWALVERLGDSLFRPAVEDAGNAGIADTDPRATDHLKQLIAGAAAGGKVDPALLASDAARRQWTPAVEHIAPALGRMGQLQSLTLLDEKRIRRYRAAFANHADVIWTVVQAPDGTILSLARIESGDMLVRAKG
jgi:hypothetical protein